MREAAQALGIEATEQELVGLETILDEEVALIEPYDEAPQAIALLQAHGLKIAVCSNLATPYGAAIYRHFPTLDGYALSYDVGVVKPNPTIYRHCLTALGVSAASTHMIGDSASCDCDGPKAVGIAGYHLDRSATGGAFTDLLCFAHSLLESR